MSTTTLTPPSPRQRRALAQLMSIELKLAWRRPIGLIVAVGVPLALLVIFGSIPATTRPQASLGGVSFFTLYVPSLLIFVLIVVGLMGTPQQLATYRQQGVLRRMATTPVQPAWLLAAQVIVNVIFAVIGIAIVLGVGALAFNLALPHTIPENLLALFALLLTAAGMLALGLCVAALAGSPQVAQALTLVCFYPLMFFSGMYVPLSEIHSSLVHQIAKVLPTGAGYNALHAAFTGHSPSAGPLLVLAAWAVGCSVIAARRFRWE
jgi:ABC-2 type transport system permease protein